MYILKMCTFILDQTPIKIPLLILTLDDIWFGVGVGVGVPCIYISIVPDPNPNPKPYIIPSQK